MVTTSSPTPTHALNAKTFGVLAVVGLVVAFSLSSRATGLVLVGGDAVRLLHWEAGRVSSSTASSTSWSSVTGVATRRMR